jgi:ribonuclease D
MHSISKPVATEVVDPESAQTAVRNARMIGPKDDLHDLLSQWSGSSVLGLDTEFVRERTFFPRPGLVQVSDGQSVWLLDPVDREDFSGMAKVLDNQHLTKILHSVGEDLEVFRLLTGTLPTPLFDTQIAAAMLGFPLQCRYETLVEECFEVALPGGQARSNWCKRPLAPTLLEYAAQDVIWLPRLQSHLGEALAKRDRLHWLEEDCNRLIRDADEPFAPLNRIKGASRLDDRRLARLKNLADWREHQAQTRDLPRGFILRDDVMIALVEAAGDGNRLQSVFTTLPHPVRRRHGEELQDILGGPEPEPLVRPPELTPLDNDQRQRLKQAQKTVRSIAEEFQIDPALIASKRELSRLVRGDRPDWLNGWRGKLLGDLASI